ncbi:MAG: UDP-forming cellulose synthase catalytic subunit [Pseudomonadota bacterium]
MTRAWFAFWAGTVVVVALVATQPIGLDAQFSFGLAGLALMLTIRLLRAKGAWRSVFLVIAGAIVLRYAYWRITSTLPPVVEPIDFGFGLALVIAELYAAAMLVLNVFVVSDPATRPDERLRGAPESWPRVDVLVPSYNEDLDIVGTTLAAAKNMDYPADKLRVLLLDDGATEARLKSDDPVVRARAEARRDEMRAFAEELGVDYVARRENAHAKAGNLNAGLGRCDGDLVLVLDADHAPAADFLTRTVGHMQADPRLFLVQTPHFFLNADPLERNLGLHRRMPSECEMFYAVTQRGLDKWDAAYFCGSAALLRREALNEAGGFLGRTITEDCESALDLHARGWHSAYVDRAMVGGLQPETFDALITQRSRWAQGMMQILMLSNPVLKSGLSWPQRLGYLSAGLFWLFCFARLTFMLAPVAYIFFDLRIYVASLQEFVAYTLFFLAACLLVREQIFGAVRWPWLSEIYEYAQSPYLAWAVIRTWLNPKAPSFTVTAKGATLEEHGLSPIAWPLLGLFTLLAVTTGFGFWRVAADLHGDELLMVVTGWSVFNLLVAGVSLGVVAERRERRRFPRLEVDVEGVLTIEEAAYPVRVRDAGLGGVRVESLSGPMDVEGASTGTLTYEGTSFGCSVAMKGLNVRIAGRNGQGPAKGVGLMFDELTAVQRREIARLLYPSSERFERLRRSRQKARNFTAGTIEFALWAVYQVARGLSYVVMDVWRRLSRLQVRPAAIEGNVR